MSKEEKEEKKFNSLFEERENNLMTWVAFWRANPHRFVADYLKIRLHLFQQMLFFMMNRSRMFVYIASRSQGKSFLISIYAVVRCILYPGTIVVIASSTKDQAALIIDQKIRDLYNKYSAVRDEIGSPNNIKASKDDASVQFLNGSRIITSVAGEGGRGRRAHVLVVDEFLKLDDHKILTKILRPMAGAPRKPMYVQQNPEKYSDYVEENNEVLLSSAWYKNHWGWGEFKSRFQDMLDGKNYFVTSIPYEVSMLHGIIPDSERDLYASEERSDPFGFMMEYEAMFVGENENGLFSLDSIVKNRTLKKSFRPPTDMEYVENKERPKNHQKKLTNMEVQNGEIRIVALDVAMRGTKDTSVYTCLRMVPKKNGEFEKHVVYIESKGGSSTDTELAIRLKQLYYDFEATYAVLDMNGNGVSVFSRCAEVLYDEVRDIEYPRWHSINDKKANEKYDTSSSLPVLYTVIATDGYNTKAILQLNSSLESGSIKFLISDDDKREALNPKEKGEFLKMSAYEQTSYMLPYRQTSSLQNELIALERKMIRGGNIQVVTTGKNTKDRFSSLLYANYQAHEIELEQKKKASRGSMSEYMFETESWNRKARKNWRDRVL